MSYEYLEWLNIMGRNKPIPVPVIGLSRKPLGPKIDQESRDLKLTIKGHKELINLEITNLRGYELVLGMP